MLEPFNVASPSVAVTVAFLLMVKLFLPSNSTFLPLTVPVIVAVSCATTLALPASAVTVPATSAFSAVTVTLFLPVKLPVSVLVNFSVAVTPTLPFSAMTVPLLLIFLPANVASPSVAVTVAFLLMVKLFLPSNSTFLPLTMPVIVAVSCATTLALPSSAITVPATFASFALTVTSV
nr:hypothetical protein BV115_01661 [Haemophilus influenzae]